MGVGDVLDVLDVEVMRPVVVESVVVVAEAPVDADSSVVVVAAPVVVTVSTFETFVRIVDLSSDVVVLVDCCGAD